MLTLQRELDDPVDLGLRRQDELPTYEPLLLGDLLYPNAATDEEETLPMSESSAMTRNAQALLDDRSISETHRYIIPTHILLTIMC